MFVKSEMGPHSQGLTPATESVSLAQEEEVLILADTLLWVVKQQFSLERCLSD